MGSLNARICGSLPCTNVWVPLNAQICGFLWFYGSIELATLWVPLSAPTCCYVGVARWDLLGGSCPLVPDAAVPCTVGVARLPPCFRVGLPVGLTLRHIRIGAPMRRLPGQQGPFVRLHRPVARLPLSCILKGTGRSRSTCSQGMAAQHQLVQVAVCRVAAQHQLVGTDQSQRARARGPQHRAHSWSWPLGRVQACMFPRSSSACRPVGARRAGVRVCISPHCFVQAELSTSPSCRS